MTCADVIVGILYCFDETALRCTFHSESGFPQYALSRDFAVAHGSEQRARRNLDIHCRNPS